MALSITIPDYQPLSNNRMWRGRRFKTEEYESYERDLLLLLPYASPLNYEPGLVHIAYRFYIPDKRRRDISNFIKPLEDILVKRGYFADDSYVQAFSVERRTGPWRIEINIERYLG